MAPRVNRKILEKYYEFNTDNAKCKRCSRIFKSDRMFNLKTHVFKVHKISKEVFAYEKTSCNPVSYKNKQKIRKQVIKVEISKKQLIRSYIGLVTEDNIPFNILSSENLKNIIDPICRGISVKYNKKVALGSENCKQVLQSVSDNIRDAIKIELKQRLLSLKIDSATCLSPNVFGISAQFIKDNEIQSRTLGMMELKGGVGCSSPRNLAPEILTTLTKYGVSLSQIVSITSDNGANMINTPKILSPCSIFEDEHEAIESDDGNEIYLKNIEMFEDFPQIHSDDIQICRYAAHTAQLCALDVMQDTEIKHLLLSCRNLVKHVKKVCNGYREIFENKSLTIPELDSPTSWGSTYNMVMSLKNAKDVLVNVKPIKKESIDENFVLNDSFWDFLEAYCVALQPLQHTIVQLQQDQLHYGDFYAEWLKCKICTEKMFESDDKTYKGKIAQSLLQSMEYRTIQLLDNEYLISCLYLDPRFNHTLNETQKREAATCLKKLYERFKSTSIHIDPKVESSASSLESKQYSQKANEFLNEYLAQNFKQTSSENIDVLKKIDNVHLPFLGVDINVLHFWGDKQYSDPELYALSNICFAVPPTQDTIEEVFSSLKLILADNRNRINQDTLENILLVKLNAACLDQAIDDLSLFEGDA